MAEPSPPNPQIELAKERNRIAADRTLLAWIRVSIALIGIGFGVDRALAKLYGGINDAIPVPPLTRLFSLLIVGLGVLTVSIAIIDYRGEIYRLRQADYTYQPRPALGMMVAGSLAAIAIAIWCATWRFLSV